MKPPPGYIQLTPEDGRIIVAAINMAIATLDHWTILAYGLGFDRPEHDNKNEARIRDLKKLRQKLTRKPAEGKTCPTKP